MTTETDLRAALHARADDAPVVDVEHLLAHVTGDVAPVRSAVGSSRGRRWAIAGVAAGFVALAVGAGTVVAGGSGPDTGAPAGPGPSVSGSPSTDGAAALSAAAAARIAAESAAAAASSAAAAAAEVDGWPVDPGAPTQPRPVATDWQDAQSLQDSPETLDDSAVVFTQQAPITAFYVRSHQQLFVLSGGAQAKDSSDAQWWTAVQVYLPGSGFDPSTLGDPETITVNGIERELVTLPRLVRAGGSAQAPSLLWAVGDAWVVLQVDLPSASAAATSDQLAAAAALLDIHHG